MKDEIDEFLGSYPPAIAVLAQRLRVVMAQAVPDAVERLRPGWRLIGYDLAAKGRGTYFAWVLPEAKHIHIGWPTGTLMSDPDHLLRGTHLELKKARYLTFVPGDRVPARIVSGFTRQAVRLTLMSRGERELLAASRREADADR